MKKLIFVFFVFISVSNAQLIRNFGIKVGATLASQDWKYSENNISDWELDNKLGLNVGIFAELLDIQTFSIVTELNYVQKGGKKDFPLTSIENPDGDGRTTEFQVNLDYINISLLGKIRFNFFILKPYILAGPRFDYEIKNEMGTGIKNTFELFDNSLLGFKVGIGTELNLLAIDLLAEIIYDMNFKPIGKNNFSEFFGRSIDFRVGVAF